MAEKDATFAGLSFDEIKDLTAAGLPLDQIKELGKAGFTAEQMMELAGTMPKSAGGLSKQDLIDVQVAASSAAAEAGAKETRKVLHPQNAQHPGISAFSHPEGEVKQPKPPLRTTFVNGHREDAEQLTPMEIEAYNAISRGFSARDGQWVCDVRRNGKTEELHIKLPVGMDTKPNEPIALIMRELSMGKAAVDPISLAERVAELERQLASATVGASA